MEDRLKPCPFCGGEAKLNSSSPYFVKCSKCFAKSGVASTSAFAVINWNTRKPMDRIVEQLEEMEEKALRVQNYDVSFYATGQIHKAIEIVKAGGKDV